MSNLNVTNVNTRDIDEGTIMAWANLNGTGTIALRDSFNVASVDDNATGDFTFNFTNDMGNADFAPAAVGGEDSTTPNSNAVYVRLMTRATGNVRFSPADDINNAIDPVAVCWNISGDLA